LSLQGWRWPAAVLLVLALAGAFRFHGVANDLLYDPLAYAEYAYNLAHGHFTLADDFPIAHRLPVLVPVAASYAAFGVSEASTHLWPMALGLAHVLLVIALGARLFDRATGLLAGFLLALLPLEVVVATSLLPDIVMSTFLTGAVFGWTAGLERPDRPRAWPLLAGGACFVIAALTRAYAAVLGVFFLADAVRVRPRLDALAWLGLGAAGVAIPLALAYQAQAGSALYPLQVQSAVFGEKYKPEPYDPLYYARNFWNPRSAGGWFGLLFFVTGAIGLVRWNRRRTVLLLWMLPLFLFLQFGSMSVSHYKHVSQQPRYITPLCAPLVLWAASVLADLARGRGMARWAALWNTSARALAAGLAVVLGGLLLVHSWGVVSAEHAKRAAVARAFERATEVLRHDPTAPIFFDHWRTGLAFSYYFGFTEGASFYQGADDSARIRRRGGFGGSRFGYLPWFASPDSIPAGWIVLDEDVVREAHAHGAPAASYLGVRLPAYVFAPPASWRLVEDGRLRVYRLDRR